VLLATCFAATITVQELATVFATLRRERDTDVLASRRNLPV
jgi:hypothetical protein